MAGQKVVLKKNSNNFSVKMGKVYVSIEDSLIPYLCDELVIEKGVTFGDFFNIILKHHEIYSDVFYSHLSGVPLSDFLKEWLELPKGFDFRMEKLIVRWDNMAFFDKGELNDEENLLEINWLPSFGGEGKDENGNEVEYGVEFAPLNELRNFPLELIENTKVYNITTDETYVYFERSFTVYEVLSAIFYEITFIGGPNERDGKMDELKDIHYEIEEEFGDKKDIEYKQKSLDNILKKLNIDKPKEEGD